MDFSKKMLLLATTFFATTFLQALEKKNIFYYDPDWPKQGNLEYLKQRCVLDLRIPDKKKNYPTLVWFHGGSLNKGSKFYPPIIDSEEIAIVAVNYRLSGEKAHCPDYLYDAAAAVAWVLKHIREYDGDPAQVYVSGHSAGGYLAAMIALAPKYLNTFQAFPQQLAAVLPLSGQMTTHFTVLNECRKKSPTTPYIQLDEYAPICHASKEGPPMILIVGDTNWEWPARVEENLLLAARLKRNFGRKDVYCYSLESFNHGTVVIPGLWIINNHIKGNLKKPKDH